MSNKQKKNYLYFDHYDLLSPRGELLKKNLSFSLDEGDFVAVSGDNGRGKTTFLKLIYEMLIKVNRGVVYLPQLSNISSTLPFSLKEIIELYSELPAGYEGQFLTPKLLNKTWNQCSGGEKRRALLEQAILKKPDILILDEPFNHLDQRGIEDVENELYQQLKMKKVKAIVIASHRLNSKSFSWDEDTTYKEILL